MVILSFSFADHTVFFYALGGPEFVVGLDVPMGDRNILGVILTVSVEAGMKVIKLRSLAQNIIQTLGGKKIHQVTSVPDGVKRGLNEEERDAFAEDLKYFIEFGKFTFKVFEDVVLKNTAYVDLILSDIYTHRFYSMSLVDANNKVNFYDGKVRVVDPDSNEFCKHTSNEYTTYVSEHTEKWNYLKYPYLK
jgi:F420-non-reducing hydrogenase large subunit